MRILATFTRVKDTVQDLFVSLLVVSAIKCFQHMHTLCNLSVLSLLSELFHKEKAHQIESVFVICRYIL